MLNINPGLLSKHGRLKPFWKKKLYNYFSLDDDLTLGLYGSYDPGKNSEDIYSIIASIHSLDSEFNYILPIIVQGKNKTSVNNSNSINTQITITPNEALRITPNPTTNITLCYWYNKKGIENKPDDLIYIELKQYSESYVFQTEFELQLDGNSYKIKDLNPFTYPRPYTYGPPDLFSDNNFHFITIKFTYSEVLVYVDNVLTTSLDMFFETPYDYNELPNTSGTFNFNVTSDIVDEISILGDATQEDIDYIYNNGNGRFWNQ